MEPVFQAHPIPQNVTNFEFHLVGDMTLKQFGYLAAGVGLAFLVFTTLSTAQPLIAWPIIIISALLGVAFAFLPIQERPLDHWVGAFFRAIFKPTSLRFSSKVITPEDPLFSKRLNHYLKTYKKAPSLSILPPLPIQTTAQTGFTHRSQTTTLGGKKQSFIDKFKAGQTSFGAPEAKTPAPKPPTTPAIPPQAISTPQAAPTPQPHPAPAVLQASSPTPGILRNPEVISHLPSAQASQPKSQPTPTAQPSQPKDLKKTVELAKEAHATQQEIIKIEASLSQIKQQAAQPGTDPKTYIEEFQDLLSKLQKLNEKASNIAKELAEVSQVQPAPQDSTISKTQIATPIKAKSIPTLKLTSFPNVVNGIVTDSQGNYLEGAIVVAHDKQGLPVRALKSNKLGQFVAATPLPNGEYTIVVEKDNLVFDKVGVELKNEILPPILVSAKKLASTEQSAQVLNPV